MPEPALTTPPSAPPPPPPAPAAATARPLVQLQSSPTETPSQALFRQQQESLTRSDAWRDPNIVIRKDAAGNVTASPRADTASPTPGEPKPGEPQQQPRTPSGNILLAEGIELSEQELRDLVAHKAQTDSQKLTTPKPGEYQLKFNDDFVLPQGTQWVWNENEPLLAQVREFASANNMSQASFSRLLQMHAASRLAEDLQFAEAKAREIRALGDSANSRVDSVKTWLKAMGGEHFAGLARVLEMAPTAATVKGLEALMHRYTTQGGGAFRGSHREPEQPGKISDEAYSKLSYAQRIEYASRFKQPGA